jgi:hypothetical protein
LAEASRAKEARSEAYAIAKGSGHTRETTEDDLRAAQHRQADLVVKLEDISAESLTMASNYRVVTWRGL